jgi:hypothetical protein
VQQPGKTRTQDPGIRNHDRGTYYAYHIPYQLGNMRADTNTMRIHPVSAHRARFDGDTQTVAERRLTINP